MNQEDQRATKAAWPTASVGGYTYQAYKKGGALGMRKWPNEGSPSDAVELGATGEAPAEALQLFRALP